MWKPTRNLKKNCDKMQDDFQGLMDIVREKIELKEEVDEEDSNTINDIAT